MIINDPYLFVITNIFLLLQITKGVESNKYVYLAQMKQICSENIYFSHINISYSIYVSAYKEKLWPI